MEISPIVREKASLILAEIQKAKSILLHCHPSPDPDSIGSALAMKSALERMGGKATVIQGDSELSEAYKHFPGAEKIVPKNFFEIDLKDFDLFIILDCGNMEMISHRKPVVFPNELRTVIIDHHASNKGYGNISLIDISSPATTFIIFQLFEEWNVKLTYDIAINLLIGMYSDTGGFKYLPTDYRVLMAAAECAKIAPDYTEFIFIAENSQSKESIYFEALALGGIETFCGDSVAISAVSHDDLKKKNIPIHTTAESEVANTLKSVIGWNIGILMIEVDPGKIKVNFRSRDPKRFDVSKLAAALGGGGHRAAAGVCLMTTLSGAKELIVEKIKELYTI